MRAKGRSLRSTCGTSRLSVSSRIADCAGSSASAACVSKDRPRIGGSAGSLGRQHHAARNDAGHEAQPRGVLLHVAGAPGGVQRAQHEAQLRVVRAGELVELARARHLVEHLGELGRAVDRVGEGLRLDHELGVLDLVERAGAVGQLHAGLEGAVALAGARRFPFAGVLVEAFDRDRLAAGAARGRHGRERGVAGDQRRPARSARSRRSADRARRGWSAVGIGSALGAGRSGSNSGSCRSAPATGCRSRAAPARPRG